MPPPRPLRGPLGRAIASGLTARLPLVMMGLALILLVRAEGHPYWAVGVVSGSFVMATAVISPLLGRLADRVGATAVLVGSTCLAAAALLVIAAIPGQLGIAGLAAVAAVAGASEPPVNAVLRAMMPRLASGESLSAAFTIEAALQETLFVAGPALVAGAVALSSPRIAVAACAAMLLIATSWFIAVVRPHTAPGRPRPAAHVLATSAMRLLIVAFALVGVTLGAIDISTIASLESHGHRDLAGLALGVWALGSLGAGLVVTRRPRKAPIERLPWLLTSMALLTLPLLIAQRDPLLLGLGLLVQGASIAPTLGTVFELVPELAGEESLTEAFAWTGSFILAGFAAGAAVAGILVEWREPATGFALAAAAPALAIVVARRLARSRVDGAAAAMMG